MNEDIWPLEFDALNYSFRRNKDGVVLGFVVHPNADCIAILAAAELGFKYKITLEPQSEGPAEVVPIARARKRPETEEDRAVELAGRRCRETDFQFWASRFVGSSELADIEDFVRERCGVQSRTEFRTNPAALEKFYALDREFREWARQR